MVKKHIHGQMVGNTSTRSFLQIAGVGVLISGIVIVGLTGSSQGRETQLRKANRQVSETKVDDRLVEVRRDIIRREIIKFHQNQSSIITGQIGQRTISEEERREIFPLKSINMPVGSIVGFPRMSESPIVMEYGDVSGPARIKEVTGEGVVVEFFGSQHSEKLIKYGESFYMTFFTEDEGMIGYRMIPFEFRKSEDGPMAYLSCKSALSIENEDETRVGFLSCIR